MRRLLLAAFLIPAVVTSCSGDDEKAPPGPIPIDAFRAEAEAANCEFEVRCGAMPDKATCKKLDRADYELVQLIADAVFGSVKYDPAAGRAWVEAVRTQKCEIGDGIPKALKAAWEPVFVGTLGAGKPCFVDDECSG